MHKFPKIPGDFYIQCAEGKLRIKAKGPFGQMPFAMEKDNPSGASKILLKFLAWWINLGYIRQDEINAFAVCMENNPDPNKIISLIEEKRGVFYGNKR